MSTIYARRFASAVEFRLAIPDPPSHSAVRSILRTLETKGLLRHEKAGKRHVYHPTIPPEKASSSALRRLLRTCFDDSVE